MYEHNPHASSLCRRPAVCWRDECSPNESQPVPRLHRNVIGPLTVTCHVIKHWSHTCKSLIWCGCWRAVTSADAHLQLLELIASLNPAIGHDIHHMDSWNIALGQFPFQKQSQNLERVRGWCSCPLEQFAGVGSSWTPCYTSNRGDQLHRLMPFHLRYVNCRRVCFSPSTVQRFIEFSVKLLVNFESCIQNVDGFCTETLPKV
jgi:hypothetical protein